MARILGFLVFLSVLFLPHEARKFYGKKMDPDGPFSFIVSPLPHEDPDVVKALPSAWDWRNVDGVDYTSAVLDQHQPGTYCGACYAFAATSHMNDRFNVARKNAWPTTKVSVQVLITCGASMPKGCDGGDLSSTMKFIHQYGLPDDTCHNYESKNLVCNALNLCMDCMDGYTPQCWGRAKFPLYRIKEYGQILPNGNVSDLNLVRRQGVINDMVVRMKAEIWKRGPIICQMACPDPIDGPGTDPTKTRGYVDDYTPYFNIEGDNYAPHVLHHPNYTCVGGDWNQCVDHDVVVSGWGIEDGKPYWVVRNSWGAWWGEAGWFRIVMGLNNLGIESRCDFLVPDVQDLETDARGLPHFTMGTAEAFADRFAKASNLASDNDIIVQYM